MLELVVSDSLQSLELNLSVGDFGGESSGGVCSSDGRSKGLGDLAPQSGLHVAGRANRIGRPFVDHPEVGPVETDYSLCGRCCCCRGHVVRSEKRY